MYLTRLRLNPGSAQARRDLGNPYEMHRTLVRAFVAGENDVPARFLWRLQLDGAWTNPEVLVQSAHVGNWTPLEALPGYLADSPQCKRISLGTWLQPGRRYRFRLRANPTVCRDGKRVGLIGEDAQTSWLHKRAPAHGFRVESVLVTGTEVLKALRGSKPITLRAATFEGYLECTDVASLEQALLTGVGRGKAFGLGLLSIALTGLK